MDKYSIENLHMSLKISIFVWRERKTDDNPLNKPLA